MGDGIRFAVLQSRDFRLFWFGQLISLSGTWMQSVAQGWLVYRLTESPFYLGFVAACGTLPILLFTLAGGIVADRFKKRNLILLTQILSIVPAISLGVLTDLSAITVWHVAFFAAMLGTINAFDMPARQSFIVEMVGRENLTSAIALNSAAFHGARMVGPVIAGVTITTLGLAACFYLNAISFVAVIISLAKIKTHGGVAKTANGVVKDLVDGLQYIKGRSDIFQIIVIIAVFSLFGMPFITLLPVFAEAVFRQGPEGFGIMVGATGAGALMAALFLAVRDDIKNKAKFMSVSAICFSVLLLIFSLLRHFPLAIGVLVCIGWSLVSFFAVANSYIQLSVPDALRGRAMSVYTFVFLGTAPIGNSIIGAVADRVGTTLTVGATAVVCLAVSIVFCRRICENREARSA